LLLDNNFLSPKPGFGLRKLFSSSKIQLKTAEGLINRR
jgi:hypothetical protein